jgi:hypothetical protein
VPALLALLFSISTTGRLPRPTLQPLFDGDAAATLASQLSSEYPSRVPGTLGAADATRWYAQTMSASGLDVREDSWHADLPELGTVELHNVVTVVPGRSAQAIVLVAHRDNQGAGTAYGQNASGTAALIEIARGFAPQETVEAAKPNRTLVLVSTDGGAYGGAGAYRFATTSPYARDALAVVVLDGIGGLGPPRLAIAGDGSHTPAPTLVSTAIARIREQTGVTPAVPSVPTQLVDLGVPYAAGEQGPFLARDIAAVTISTAEPGHSSLPAGDGGSRSRERLGQLGRATESLVDSIDASVGRAFRAPDMLFFRGRTASGWAVRLALVVSVVPFALGVLDLVVRGRRRRLRFAPAVRGLRARVLFWLYAALLVWIGALTGVLPTGAPLPFPPNSSFVTDWPVAGTLLLGVALGLGWLFGRRRLVPSTAASTEERLAGYTVALAWLGIAALVVAIVHPYALVFVLPSLYAWLWLPVQSRAWSRAIVYTIGLAGPVVGLVLLAHELALSVGRSALYVTGLVTVGYVPLGTVLLAVAWFGAAGQLAALAFGRYAPYAGGAEPPPRGVVRESVATVARRERERRYARAR